MKNGRLEFIEHNLPPELKGEPEISKKQRKRIQDQVTKAKRPPNHRPVAHAPEHYDGRY